MKEQLISFETAKLAKEKGMYITNSINLGRYTTLGENIVQFYDNKGELCAEQDYNELCCASKDDKNDVHSSHIPSPTQSFLQKWLRETKDIKWPILVYVVPFFSENPRQEQCCVWRRGELITLSPMDTYGGALEAGLRKGLSLIKLEES